MSHDLLLIHFDAIADAPGGIARLRQLILQLAVQGRLVEQNPADESASVLLEGIRVQKAQRAGAAKQPHPRHTERSEASVRLSGGTQGDSAASPAPFAVPQGWEWTTLAEIGQINPRNDVSDETEVSFVPMTLVSQIYGEPVQSEVRVWRDVKKGFTHFAEGDVALAKITPCFQNGKAAVMRNLHNGVGAGTTELHVLRPIKATVLSDYVYTYLKSPNFVEEGIPRMTGTAGQKRVPNDYFAFNPFPLPPLAEQRRIVERVDALMALCDALEVRQDQRGAERQRLLGALVDGLLAAGDAGVASAAWARLSASFELVLAAPEDIAPLRQAVLQLAVQGRLVEQNPADEPASALLERIRVQKAQRAGTSKSRHAERSEASRTGFSSETLRFAQGDIEAALPAPFTVPQGWDRAKLGELCEVGTGSTPLTTNSEYYNDGSIPWITSSATALDYIDAAETFITEKAVFEYRLKLYPQGTLIVALYGQGKTRGQISELRISATINQACAAIVIPEELADFRRFVRIAFEQRYDELRALAEGGAQPNLNLGKIKDMLVMLPPLAEQRRIVARVEQLMALCEGLQARLREERAAAERLSVALCAAVAAGRAAAQPSARVALSNRPAPQTSLEAPQQHSSVAAPLFTAYVSYLAWVVQQHRNTPTAGTLGKVKMEKAAHLGEALGRIDLGRHPVRKPHGPADSERLDQAIAYGREIEAFAVVERSDAEWGYVFVPLPRLDEMASQFEASFGSQIERIRHLSALLVPLKTREAEAIATLYAVWNDQFHTGEQPDDEQIFAAFRAFHPKKERFRSAILVKWLTWMREHGIVPDGSAKLTPPAGYSAAAPAVSTRQRVARPAASDSAEGSYAAAVALLAERGALTNGELQAALGLDGTAARALLRRLVAAGLARQEGERRAARYVGLAERH